jgi:hypothetical protein
MPTDKRSLIDLYQEIWEERDHTSFVSDKRIPFFSLSNFSHCLAKGQGKYPKFKYYKKNIVLLLPYEHFLVDSGTIDLRAKYQKENPSCDWERLYNLQAELKSEYPLIIL